MIFRDDQRRALDKISCIDSRRVGDFFAVYEREIALRPVLADAAVNAGSLNPFAAQMPPDIIFILFYLLRYQVRSLVLAHDKVQIFERGARCAFAEIVVYGGQQYSLIVAVDRYFHTVRARERARAQKSRRCPICRRMSRRDPDISLCRCRRFRLKNSLSAPRTAAR